MHNKWWVQQQPSSTHAAAYLPQACGASAMSHAHINHSFCNTANVISVADVLCI